mmetsp:Transcript_14989/g.42071  ORF Transcript_14989/g.42071 Transcript_14989/m.42071 type:complete len:287 (-) Transcript_14989:197-1057(-)
MLWLLGQDGVAVADAGLKVSSLEVQHGSVCTDCDVLRSGHQGGCPRTFSAAHVTTLEGGIALEPEGIDVHSCRLGGFRRRRCGSSRGHWRGGNSGGRCFRVAAGGLGPGLAGVPGLPQLLNLPCFGFAGLAAGIPRLLGGLRLPLPLGGACPEVCQNVALGERLLVGGGSLVVTVNLLDDHSARVVGGRRRCEVLLFLPLGVLSGKLLGHLAGLCLNHPAGGGRHPPLRLLECGEGGSKAALPAPALSQPVQRLAVALVQRRRSPSIRLRGGHLPELQAARRPIVE